MRKNLIILLSHIIIFSAFSCNHVEKNIAIHSEKNIIFNELLFDTIEIDLSNTSSIGHFEIVNNEIIFFDHEFSLANVLNESYKIENKFLGFGRGPNEISGIHKVTTTPDSDIVILNTDWFIYRFDKNWNKISTVRLNQGNKTASLSKASVFPTPKSTEAYEYESSGISIKMLNEYTLLIPVTTFGVVNEFGNFGLTNKYYKDYCALGRVNLVSGILDSVFLGRPAVYLEKKNKYLANFNFYDFDAYQQNYWVSWEIDSLIYQYKYPDSLICAFGYSGTDMNTNYRPHKKFNDHEHHFYSDRKNFGRYTGIIFDEISNSVLRTYYKGDMRGYGLQIYNNNVLIADISVPDNFRILGRIDDYFFASGLIDEYEGRALLFKFKLE
jgi:hypothetical protein